MHLLDILSVVSSFLEKAMTRCLVEAALVAQVRDAGAVRLLVESCALFFLRDHVALGVII